MFYVRLRKHQKNLRKKPIEFSFNYILIACMYCSLDFVIFKRVRIWDGNWRRTKGGRGNVISLKLFRGIRKQCGRWRGMERETGVSFLKHLQGVAFNSLYSIFSFMYNKKMFKALWPLYIVQTSLIFKIIWFQ